MAVQQDFVAFIKQRGFRVGKPDTSRYTPVGGLYGRGVTLTVIRVPASHADRKQADIAAQEWNKRHKEWHANPYSYLSLSMLTMHQGGFSLTKTEPPTFVRLLELCREAKASDRPSNRRRLLQAARQVAKALPQDDTLRCFVEQPEELLDRLVQELGGDE